MINENYLKHKNINKYKFIDLSTGDILIIGKLKI